MLHFQKRETKVQQSQVTPYGLIASRDHGRNEMFIFPPSPTSSGMCIVLFWTAFPKMGEKERKEERKEQKSQS